MTDDLSAQFEQASKDVKALSKRPSDDDMLELYALYKQATDGDAGGKKPGMFDFVARAKFEAWEEGRRHVPGRRDEGLYQEGPRTRCLIRAGRSISRHPTRPHGSGSSSGTRRRSHRSI